MTQCNELKSRTEYLQALKRLAKLRPQRFYRALFVDWAIIIAALVTGATFPNLPVLILCGFVIGNRQQALAVLAHESVHFLVHKNRRLNDIVGMIFCAWPLGSFLTGFRRFHLDHHKFVGTDRDPELKIYEFGKWMLPRRQSSLLRLVADLVGLGIRDLFQMMSLFVPTKKWESAGVIVTWLGMAGLCWIIERPWLILLWAVPLFTVFWALARFRIWTEHRGIQFTHRFHTNWLVREIFYPHGIGIHYEHHKWSFIPFYHLPQARELDRQIPIVALSEVLEFLETADADRYASASAQEIMTRDFQDNAHGVASA